MVAHLQRHNSFVPGRRVGDEMQWSEETARPSDNSLKFRQVTGIVKACSDLLRRETGKLGDDVLGRFTGGEISQDETHRNTRSLQARLAPKDFRIAHDVTFPFHGHEAILARL